MWDGRTFSQVCTYKASSGGGGKEARGKHGVCREISEEQTREDGRTERASRKSRIQELRQELHSAELEEALEDTSGVLESTPCCNSARSSRGILSVPSQGLVYS